MSTAEKAEEILRWIVARCNEKPESNNTQVGFAADWGGNSVTVWIGSRHTHVGLPETEWDDLVDQLHALLTEGRGLSLA